jgi:hypothetical protein
VQPERSPTCQRELKSQAERYEDVLVAEIVTDQVDVTQECIGASIAFAFYPCHRDRLARHECRQPRYWARPHEISPQRA